MEDHQSEPEQTLTEAGSSPAESPRVRRHWGVLGIVLLAVVSLALAAVAGYNWQQARDLDGTEEAALVAAREHAVTIASYDHRELDAYFERVGKIATGDFSKRYAKANDDLRKLLTETKAVVRATVLDAAVVSVSEDEATVLLFVDQNVQNTAVEGDATDRNRMRMTLKEDGDDWLVSNLELK